ncbi:hypothetical protein CTheo_324 [Ceratobasidium theobromae]|uniref:Uncharacterized protein n=1 Tax=Ceratobasidium theobromae TaxID=1582974 RepID=A0A5N5QXJ8_9AGAM|nr:hypothetical protein CTheo_324 [Ceratobasidium theobromae]
MPDDRVGSEDSTSPDGDDGRALPTYEDLAARERGPNSRFGRWQAWVEKRAAERYADDPQRRRQSTGWGPTKIDTPEAPQPPAYSLPPEQIIQPPPGPSPVTRAIARCLSVVHFGSRFIPHSNTPIVTVLPLGVDDRFILFGTAQGLAVLDVLPALHGAQPSNAARVLEEAKPRNIWAGEGVWQMSLLESQDLSGPNPQGTVLVLVGAEANESMVDRKGAEPVRTLRMYNLASLTSLVKWSVTRKDAHPLDLRRPTHTNPVQPLKKHRPASGSMLSNLKAIFADSHQPPPIQPYDPLVAATPRIPLQTTGLTPPRSNTRDGSPSHHHLSVASPSETTGGWDIVEDLPLRWATDYVSLSKPGSKLAGMSVLFFELWRDLSGGPGTERTYLAVATRQCIFLYESVPGERAFRIVKEFYTPLPARSIRFIQQLSIDPGYTNVARSFSSMSSRAASHPIQTHSRNASHSYAPRTRRTSFGDTPRAQLALFVTFPKKAGLIRLGDAAVGEVELWDEEPVAGPMGRGTARRSFESLSNAGFGVERERGVWAPLESCDIPPLSMETEPYAGPSSSNGESALPFPSAMAPSPGGYQSTTWSSTSSQRPLFNNGNSLQPRADTNPGNYSPSLPSGPMTTPPVSFRSPVPTTPTPSNLFAGSEYPKQVALLTRGRRTDIVELPLRTPVGSRPPLCTIMWLAPPSKLSPRICVPGPGFADKDPYLQIVAFLKEGVDVAEVPLSRLRFDRAKPKGKGRADEIKLIKVDVGGPAGYLASGGRWHRFGCSDGSTTSPAPGAGVQSGRGVQRADSTWSVSSWDSSSAQEHRWEKAKQLKSEEGYYAWVCRGHGDFYIVWIGGGMADDPAHANGPQPDE